MSYPNGDRHHNKYSYYLNPILLGKKNNEDDYFEDTSIAPVYNIYSGGIALGSAATVSEHAEDGIAVGVGAKTDGQMGTSVGFFTQAIGRHSSAYGFQSVAYGNQSIAMGERPISIGSSSMAIGAYSVANPAYYYGYLKKTKNGNGLENVDNPLAKTSVENQEIYVVDKGETLTCTEGEYKTKNGNDCLKSTPALAIGAEAKALNVNALAIGTQAEATGVRSVAIHGNATEERAVAVGFFSEANAHNAVALGARASVGGESSIAVGEKTIVEKANSTAVGQLNVVRGERSGSFGYSGNTKENFKTYEDSEFDDKNYADRDYSKFNYGVFADDAYAFGNKNKIDKTANKTFVLGNNITATNENNVILGNESEDKKFKEVDGAKNGTFVTVGPLKYNGFAGTPKGVVSVGKKGAERQLVNVAPGEISSTSTDAINGSQLYAATNALLDQFPVVYTNKNGDKVFKKPDGKFTTEDGTEVPSDDVIASMNDGDKKADSPKTLANVKGNLPDTYNIDNKYNPGNKGITKEYKLPENLNVNNAATVGDILNSGWNLKNNGQASDFVKPYDSVDFTNGTATTAVVEPSKDGNATTIKYNVNVDDKTITAEEVTDPKTKQKITQLTAKTITLADANKDGKIDEPTTEKKALVTAENITKAINASGFKLKTSATSEGSKDESSTPANGDGELINPGDSVEMIAGKNLTVKQENGKVTYATKDKVDFDEITLSNEDKNKVKLVNGAPVATEANVNPDENKPTASLNITSADNKPTQLTGVGSVLNTTSVTTNSGKQGEIAGQPGTDKLLNLGTKEQPLEDKVLNSAATVRDLTHLGWELHASGNGYVDTVKNANKVDFKGQDGISVTGVTNKDGVREIIIALEKGEVVKPNEFVVTKEDGSTVIAIKVGDNYYAKTDIDLTTGKPKANSTALTPKEGTTPENKGTGFVTGNQVATAIQESGFTVGKLSDIAGISFDNQDEKINPNDNLKFADGKGTAVNLGTVKTVDPNGEVVTTTVVKVDIDTAKLENNPDGSVKEMVADVEKLNQAIDEAKKAVDAAQKAKETADAGEDQRAKEKATQVLAEAQTKLTAAQQAADKAGLNKIATAQNVADAINGSGWTASGSETAGSTGKFIDNTPEKGDKMVNPGDTLTLSAGNNIEITQNGLVYSIATQDDVDFNTVTIGKKNVVYKDADGKELVKVGDKFYDKAEVSGKSAEEIAKLTEKNVDNTKSVAPVQLAQDNGITTTITTVAKGADGKPTLDANGKPTETVTTTAAPSALSVKDALGKESQINGIASAVGTKEIVTAPQGKTGEPGSSVLVDLTPPSAEEDKVKWKSSAATVGDIANMGWVISAEDSYKDTVKNANEVKFLGTGLATVSGKTDEAGVRTITVNVDAQRAVESAQLPVVYTNRDGDKLVKVADKFYKAGDVTNGIPNQGVTPVNSGDVIAAMNNGDNNTTTPMALSNVQSHLTPTTSTTQLIDKVGAVSTVEAPTTSQTAPTVAEAAKMNNKAATVGDVLNAGWNLQVNGEAKDFVKPYDTVNFGDGIGTKAKVESDGTTSTIKVNIDAGSLEANADGSVRGAAPTPKLAENLAKAEEALVAVEALGDNAPKNVLEAAKAAVYDAEKAIKQANANKVATVSNVVEAVNNSGWTATVGKTGTGEVVDKGSDKLVNPGDTVSIIAGDNMKITKDGLNYTVETKKEVTFDRVTANVVNVGPVSLSGSTAANPDGSRTNELSVGKPGEETRITNVAKGVKPTDAVNVGQLKDEIGGINNRINKATKEHRSGIAGAAAIAGLPEIHLSGKSMLAAAASTYKGENAIAIGYSRLSDNSKIKLKITGSATSQGDVIGTVGVGYAW
ncbi:YadA-like family protein [Actinobacillus seminis]|uniref:YadA-like family protein n=1 Tax=Actinobacillus seminis TaxID=722 RepID=UPI003B942029